MDTGDLLALIETEYAWASRQRGALPVRDRYRAVLSVLRDLFAQGWDWRRPEHRLGVALPDYTTPPRTSEDAAQQKAAIRLSMSAERLAQIEKPSTVTFLAQMERPRRHAGRTVSVPDLVADGEALTRDLRAAAREPIGDERDETLREVIRPHLQLVTGGARCQMAGLR